MLREGQTETRSTVQRDVASSVAVTPGSATKAIKITVAPAQLVVESALKETERAQHSDTPRPSSEKLVSNAPASPASSFSETTALRGDMPLEFSRAAEIPRASGESIPLRAPLPDMALPPQTATPPVKSDSETVTDRAVSRSTPSSSEIASAPTPQSAGEHPSATLVAQATARETLTRLEAAVPTARTRLTVEQIRELQALVSRAVQGARTKSDGSTQATFNWRTESFGPLRFTIVSRSDGVSIEISSDRREVVEALEEGRTGMERMIADAGLRVEKLEVRIRPGEWSDFLPQTGENGRHPERNSNARPETPQAPLVEHEADDAREEVWLRPRVLHSEHEWVA
jgi:hypothetical protein